MTARFTHLLLVVLGVLALAAGQSSAAEPAGAAGTEIVGQCWKDGVLLHEESLGDSSDPEFPQRAQAFHDDCVAKGGAAKFVEAHMRTPAIEIGDARGREPARGERELVHRVTLSHPSDDLVTVRWGTVGGTATPGRDYRSAGGLFTFLPGETSKLLRVALLPDRRREPGETYFVTLWAPEGGILRRAAATGTILPRLQDAPKGCECERLTAAPASAIVKGKKVAASAGAEHTGSSTAVEGGKKVTWKVTVRIPWDTTIVCGEGAGGCAGLLAVEFFKGEGWQVNGVPAKVAEESHTWPEGANPAARLNVKCTGPCKSEKSKGERSRRHWTVYKATLTAVVPAGAEVTSVSGTIPAGLKPNGCKGTGWSQKLTYRYTATTHPPKDGKLGWTERSELVELDSDGDGKPNAGDPDPWDPAK